MARIEQIEADGIAEVERRFAAQKANSVESEHGKLELKRLNSIAAIMEDANAIRLKIMSGKSYRIEDLQ